MTSIAEKIEVVSAHIRHFEQRYHRAPGSVRLLAVSKKHSAEQIRLASVAGIEDFGENYLQEATEKIALLDDLDLNWHFIGPIQANKTRGIAEHFDWVHSVAREKIARRLSEQRLDSKAPLNVCVQVNLSSQAGKSGTTLEQARALCECIDLLPNLNLRGLMAIPAPLPDLESQRTCFRQLANEFERLAKQFPAMDTLSMGMSDDFEAAIAEGSTLVRIGTAVFGARIGQ
ncbi:MAG: YggS family pyridoxal phosphate-dependent enzyme [Proteobacteria bacterium]|nr:YggS family pyridoxal phosphate-dependent enzyme [Pseudomonadota bacterium]